MSHVFISYAAEDRDLVLILCERLSENGIPVWMDVRNLVAGQDWEMEIDLAIRDSSLFLACLSKRAVAKRGFVQSELKRALRVLETVPSGDVFIIPVRLDDCDVPAELGRYHRLDYFLEDGPSRLLAAVSHHLGISGPPDDYSSGIVAVRAPKWIGGGARAGLGENVYESARDYFTESSLPLARIFNPASQHPGSFSGDACAIRFIASALTEWASVDALAVEVRSFEGVPRYSGAFPFPREKAHVYYVEIDDPAISGTNVFHSRFWGEEGPTELGAVILKRASPEVFVLRINARRPGLYTFSCFLKVSSERGSQIVTVDEGRFLFDDDEGLKLSWRMSEQKSARMRVGDLDPDKPRES